MISAFLILAYSGDPEWRGSPHGPLDPRLDPTDAEIVHVNVERLELTLLDASQELH